MNITRLLVASVATVLLAGCSSFTRPSGEALPKDARWGLVPLANYAQAPMAGDRAAIHIALSRSHKLIAICIGRQ